MAIVRIGKVDSVSTRSGNRELVRVRFASGPDIGFLDELGTWALGDLVQSTMERAPEGAVPDEDWTAR